MRAISYVRTKDGYVLYMVPEDARDLARRANVNPKHVAPNVIYKAVPMGDFWAVQCINLE